MKLSVYMLAFILSTAIHVGALTSNLLHVNAESIQPSRDRTVKLHIVPSTVRVPSAQPMKEAEEIVEKPRTVDSEIIESDRPEPPSEPVPDTPGVKSPEVILTEMPTIVELGM